MKCKAHKSNVTPVINSILVLAEVETTLWWGYRQGQDKFDVVKRMFDTADLFPIFNMMDRVSKLHYLSMDRIISGQLLLISGGVYARTL
jgi:hypothetical protein